MATRIGGKAQSEAKRARGPRRAKSSGSGEEQSSALPKARQQFLASYLPLVRRFPLEPIRDVSHLDQALAMVEELLRRDLDDGADSYLKVLTGLIEDYESKAFPILDVSEAEVLRELMRLSNLSQSALSSNVGIAQPTLSAVLRGTRGLTKDHVIALARFFHVSPEAFLRTR